MATNISTATLSGFFKDRFGEDGSMMPGEGYTDLAKRIPFSEQKLGEKITQPVRAAHSTGWTFAGGSTTGTMFALNDANSPSTVEATWTSVEFVIREKVSWKAMRAAMSSAQAFGNVFDNMISDMRESANFARDFNLLYGASDLGTIESQSEPGAATARNLVLSKATSAPGLWYKLTGCLLDAYDAYGGTKVNSTTDITLTSVGLTSSGAVELVVSGLEAELDNCTAGVVLIPKGASDNQMVGIDAIASVPTSYAGIAAANYPMFTSTSLNASSASVTYSKVMHALKTNQLKTGSGKRTALLSYSSLVDIGDNVAAIQRLDRGGAKATIGPDSVTFEGPLGMVEFVKSPICKEGEGFLLDFGCMERVGSVDFTFDPTGKGDYFEPVAGYAGHEVVGYWDQTLKVDKPQTITKITGIVNTL